MPLLIGAAMAAGLLLGRIFPGLNDALDAVKIGQTSLPIALGLLLMMYPVLAKVRYDEIGRITADRRMMAASLIFNWIVGPLVMFALAWLLLPDQPAYRTGVILVGLARCIAMVLIWTDLARGDREMAAVLVALNAVFQVLFYAVLGVFYLKVLPGWLGLDTANLDVSMGMIAKTIAIFLGHPAGRRLPDPHASASGAAAASGTRRRSCRGSPRSRCTGCCSPSSSCSRCRATRSPPIRSTSSGSRCRCWPTSRSCGSARSGCPGGCT